VMCGGMVFGWFPPDESELTPRQEAALDALLRDSLGTGAGRILRSFEQFETARPRARHYYLSLLGTHPRHAAQGYGRQLLSANLRLLDVDGAPAYLEVDDALVPFYQRYGFRVTRRFELPGGPGVNSMWRPAAAAKHLGVR
jgi:GNAT superfamily N-acetyltransferase